MWLMVSGPYTAGAASPEQRRANLRAMNAVAVELFRRGHVPVIGVNMALPMIEAAGEAAFEELMMPVSLALAERCDACIRIGGASKGADDEAMAFRRRGKPVFTALDQVPAATDRA